MNLPLIPLPPTPVPAPSRRAILYTPEHGGGWVSWHDRGTVAEKQFMLEYEPFVRALEARGRDPNEQYLARKRLRSNPGRRVEIAAVLEGGTAVRLTPLPQPPNYYADEGAVAVALGAAPDDVLWYVNENGIPEDLPLEQFLADWVARFGRRPPPFLGGLANLAVSWVNGEDRVQLSCHDGYESLRVAGSDEWL